MDEGDPRLLPLPVSPPDIDPSCPTQICLKDTFNAFLTFQAWHCETCCTSATRLSPRSSSTTRRVQPCKPRRSEQNLSKKWVKKCTSVERHCCCFHIILHTKCRRTKNRAACNCRIQMQWPGAKVWTTDGRLCLRKPAPSRVNCTHTHFHLTLKQQHEYVWSWRVQEVDN